MKKKLKKKKSKIFKVSDFSRHCFFQSFFCSHDYVQMQRFTLESESKKSRKFSKCQIFPDIVVFRGNDEKTTISFSPQKFGRDPSLHHGEGVSGPQATLMDTPY